MNVIMKKKSSRSRRSTPSTRARRDTSEVNVPRLERVVEGAERDLRQMRTALEKYKSDPRRYAPQLDNIAHDSASIGSLMRVVWRTVTGSTD